MLKNQWSRFLLLLIGSLFVLPLAAGAETIKIGGTGAALGTMTHLARAFEAGNPGVSVVVLPSLGSSGGIRALSEGAINIVVSARPLKQREQAPGVTATPYGKTAIVFATSGDVDKTDLTVAELVGIYEGTTPAWSNGQDIRIILRPESETDTKLMREFLPGMCAAMDAAKKRKGVPVMYTDQEIADAITRIPGALGPTTLSLNLSESRGFTIFSLGGVAASPETIANGIYPMTKTFYFVTGPGSGGTAAKFIAFARSKEGAAILRRMGHQVLDARGAS